MSDRSFFTNSESVVAAFGCWPTFCEAEVISFSVERALPYRNGSSLARMAIHVREYKTVGEGSVDFAHVLTKSILVRFAFDGISEVEFSEFNHQNVIQDLLVSQDKEVKDGRLLVEVESIWGFGGGFRCSAARVESVESLLVAQS